MSWNKANYEENVRELEIAKHEKLGALLGMVDAILLAEEHPDIFSLPQKLVALRAARKAYDVACAAYIDARMVTK